MFKTLERQNLNKLTKRKVRDFTTPKAFHSLKVQCLGNNVVKPMTEVSGTFKVPVSALVGDLAIGPCEFTDSTPPITRSFLLSTHCFVEFTELVQGVFQRLRMVDLLTGRECQIGVHPEVYPYALTCSGFNFFGNIIGDNIQPKRANTVAKDLDITDVPVPIAMMVIQDIPADKHKLLFGFTPFLEGDTGSAFGNFRRFSVFAFFKNRKTCLKLRRTVCATLFELRRTDTPVPSAFFDPIEEPLIPDMDTDNHSVKRITRYPCPLLMGALEELRQMRLQTIPTGIFAIDTVIPLLQSKEVVMHITKVIKHIAQTFILWMLAYLTFIGSHGVTSYQSLTPAK